MPLTKQLYFLYSNVLLTEREGRTGNIGPWSSQSKTTEDQYSPVRLKEAMLVSNLLYGKNNNK